MAWRTQTPVIAARASANLLHRGATSHGGEVRETFAFEHPVQQRRLAGVRLADRRHEAAARRRAHARPPAAPAAPRPPPAAPPASRRPRPRRRARPRAAPRPRRPAHGPAPRGRGRGRPAAPARAPAPTPAAWSWRRGRLRRTGGERSPQARSDERPRRIEATVEIDGGDHRLHGVAEQRQLPPPAGQHLRATEPQRRAEVELAATSAQVSLRTSAFSRGASSPSAAAGSCAAAPRR